MAQDQPAFDAVRHDYHVLVIRNFMETALILFAALVMIAPDQMDKAIHLPCIISNRSTVPVCKIAQHIDMVLFPHLPVPSPDDLHIHFLCGLPGPVVKPDTVCVPEMQVTNKICLHFLPLLSSSIPPESPGSIWGSS